MADKKLFVFDLDGTLAPSKSEMDKEMADILGGLLKIGKKIAVISGGGFPQYEKQFLKKLNVSEDDLANVYLFPTCGAAFYKYAKSNGAPAKWKLVYEEKLEDVERGRIVKAFESAFKDIKYTHPEQVWGDVIEYRGTQITFSALGQAAPIEAKHSWDPKGEKRQKLREAVLRYVPEFEVRLGGTTSLDVTRKGVDKSYGMRQMELYLKIAQNEMIFIGDGIFPGGNDYPVKLMGVDCIPVTGPNETKRVLREFLL